MKGLRLLGVFALLLFSCAMTLEPEQEYKVLVKDQECAKEIKKKYRVKAEAGDVLVVTLNQRELESIKKEECVKYVESPIKLKPLDKQR